MERLNLLDEIEVNNRNSIILASFVFVVFLALVYTFSQLYDPTATGLILLVGLIIIVAQLYVSYFHGDKIVLATTGAVEANRKKYPHLVNTVEGLALAAGVPTPKIYVVESPEINAFAVGRDPAHASVAVTTGLLKNLNRSELEGVLAHEMSHVKNYDIRFAMLVAVLVGLVAILSEFFVRSFRFRSQGKKSGGIVAIFLVGFLLAILAPIFTRLVQAAVSRRREFLADASGVALTRYPPGLAAALEKIAKINKGNMPISEAVSHLFFVDPRVTSLDQIFATHPPIGERVKRLRAM